MLPTAPPQSVESLRRNGLFKKDQVYDIARKENAEFTVARVRSTLLRGRTGYHNVHLSCPAWM